MTGKVNAIISGQSGVALLMHEGELTSLHAGRGTEVVRRRTSEARFLLGDATDLQVLEGVELMEVSRRLELATAQIDALHVALILLDRTLSDDTRQEAAGELQEFMENKAVSVFVESVLFAHPLPEDADLSGAFAACTDATEQTRKFLQRLASLQGPIAEVHLAWERIPLEVFGHEGDRVLARSVAVRERLFRDLVLLPTDASLDRFLVDAKLRPGMRLRQEVVHAWIESLRATRSFSIDHSSAGKPHMSHAEPKPAAADGSELYALLGGIDDYFPDRKVAPLVESPMVLEIGDDGRVLIDVGVLEGAQVGGRVLWKGSPTKGARAELVIDQVGATDSWVRPQGFLKRRIKPGERIEVFGNRAGVRLAPPPPGDAAARRALDRLAAALRSRRNGDLVEVCEESRTPDLRVAVGESGAYEIMDSEGAPFPNLSPLWIDAPGAVPRVLQRLQHLAKFRKVLTAENLHPPDWLVLLLEQCGDELGSVPEPLPPRGLVVRSGETLIFRIVNRSSVRLDIVVLDLAPDYSVTQLLPKRGSLSLLPLEPGQREIVRLHGWLPPGWQEGTDVLKVFATCGPVSFRWLELPPMGRPALPFRKGLNLSEFPEEEWVTAQVEIRVRR